jgi:magnesium chelatase family protein
VCGNLGRSDRPCGCSPAMIEGYRARVSGPLLDRFDLQVDLPPLPLSDFRDAPPAESSAIVGMRVVAARRRARERPATPIGDGARRVLHQAVQLLGLSARAHDAILRVARTIAHLAAAERVEERHVAEAVQYRCLDRPAVPGEGAGPRRPPTFRIDRP